MNSVLFLVLLAGGCFLIIFGIVSSNRWQDRRAVEVVQNDTGEKQEKIELVLGNIASIPGYDTQYVNLRSRSSGGKFSSYSGGRKTRNVLFFTGSELTTHWLYQNHTFNINEFSTLKQVHEKDKEKALAIYIETIKSDSNGDNTLDEDSGKDPLNRTKCYICISRNYEFPGKPNLEWCDGKDYDGGSGIKNYKLTKDLFELETTDGLSFKISHSCSNKVLVQIREFLEHEFNGNTKALPAA